MERIILIFLILVLIFGLSADDVPIGLRPDEEPEVERDNITGRERVDVREDDDIYREFEGHITGTAEVNVESSTGNIFVRFENSIAGNATVNIRAERGDVYVSFADDITGASEVNVESVRGDVILIGDRSSYEYYQSRNNLRVSAGGEIRYRTGSITDLISLPGSQFASPAIF